MKSPITCKARQLLASLVLGAVALLSSLSVSAEDAVWIDVRTEAEYQADHIEGVPLIPHTQIGEEIGKLSLDKSTPIKLFCRSGGRAGAAKKTLEDMGYTNVENLGAIGDARKVRGEAE
jgi:phage shock protein E